MKRFWKITLIPGLFCILAGLVLSAILLFGFSEELWEHAEEFSINEDNFFEYFATDSFVSVTRTGKRYTEADTGESYHYTVPESESITGINFKIAVGDVQIKVGDTMEMEVTDMFEGAISSYVTDGVWYITDKLLGSGSVHTEYSPNITITIPKELSLTEGTIYLAAGLMEADSLSAKELLLEVDAGRLTVFRLAVKDSLTIKNAVGEVKIYDADVKNLMVDNGIGAISLTGTVAGQNTLQCGIGEVKLSLTDRDSVNFNYDIDCGLGDIQIGDNKYSGNVTSNHCGYDSRTADYFFVKCGIGHIEIDTAGN